MWHPKKRKKERKIEAIKKITDIRHTMTFERFEWFREIVEEQIKWHRKKATPTNQQIERLHAVNECDCCVGLCTHIVQSYNKQRHRQISKLTHTDRQCTIAFTARQLIYGWRRLTQLVCFFFLDFVVQSVVLFISLIPRLFRLRSINALFSA